MSQTSFFRNTSTNTLQPFGRGGGYASARSTLRELNSPNTIGGTGFGRYAEKPNTNNNTSNIQQFQGASLHGAGRGGRSVSAAPGRHTSTPNANLTKLITNAEANPEWIQEEQKMATAPLPTTVNVNQTSVAEMPVLTEFILYEDDIVKFNSDEPPIVNVQQTATPFGSNFQSHRLRTGNRTTDRTYDDIPPFGSCKKTIGGGEDVGNRSSVGVGYNRRANGKPSNVFTHALADHPKPLAFLSSASSNTPTAAPVNQSALLGFTPSVAQPPKNASSGNNETLTCSFGVATARLDVPAAITTAAHILSNAPYAQQAATMIVVPSVAPTAQTTSVSVFNRPTEVTTQAVSTQTDAPPPSAYLSMEAGSPMRAYAPSLFDGLPMAVKPVLTVQPTTPGDYSNISITARVSNNDDFGPRTLRVIHEHRNVPVTNIGGCLPLISSSTSSSSNVSRGRLVSQEVIMELTESLKQIVRSVEAFGERLRAFAEAT